MRQTYHICLSSHDEVMYRNEEDLIMGFNSLALAVFDTESRLLAEGFIPTHNHKAVQTDDPKILMKKERYTYTRYFNAKYHRRGKLGERNYFQLAISGVNHTQTLLNYVIRQGLHHGLAATPFDYAHCSANCYFKKELGKEREPDLIDARLQYKYLPEHKTLPEGYHMSSSGLILREDVVDSRYVQEVYITARNFLFHMNKLTDEKVIQSQKDENNTPPVTLEMLEQGIPEFNLQKSLIFEQGRVNNNYLTDLELCNIIDNNIIPRYLKDYEVKSIYNLPEYKREEIGIELLEESRNPFNKDHSGYLGNKKASPQQIRRCLALNRNLV